MPAQPMSEDWIPVEVESETWAKMQTDFCGPGERLVALWVNKGGSLKFLFDPNRVVVMDKPPPSISMRVH